mmetsp:Transcript_30388/g.85029  ORF Transcript_30388/g.85029 Transcript_30388/m.85029 type:complete len:139 (+) Transcript_30388:116-532(+)
MSASGTVVKVIISHNGKNRELTDEEKTRSLSELLQGSGKYLAVLPEPGDVSRYFGNWRLSKSHRLDEWNETAKSRTPLEYHKLLKDDYQGRNNLQTYKVEDDGSIPVGNTVYFELCPASVMDKKYEEAMEEMRDYYDA